MKGREVMDWINVDKDRDKKWNVVVKEMNIWVP
jgi:hypothetical protein